ncbi:hypothetical protein [Symbiopectobacterium sp. RP]|uniref:hypothetical protein n=1 Tax=Symbiopectobacterium sp. RP TaxID=3248553 RepID=UPI003D28CEEF
MTVKAVTELDNIPKRLKNDYSQCPDMWKKIQLIVIKIMSLCYNFCINKIVLVTLNKRANELWGN